jgi:hypothetical protein
MNLDASFYMVDKQLSIPESFGGRQMVGQVSKEEELPAFQCLVKSGTFLLVSQIRQVLVALLSRFISPCSFRPLEKKPQSSIELCMCCSCYPYEEDEEELAQYSDELGRHPYLAPTPQSLSQQPNNAQDANATHSEAV